jgi:hypothetical protein
MGKNGSLLLSASTTSAWPTTRTGTPCGVQTFLETLAAALCTVKVLGSSLGKDTVILKMSGKGKGHPITCPEGTDGEYTLLFL